MSDMAFHRSQRHNCLKTAFYYSLTLAMLLYGAYRCYEMDETLLMALMTFVGGSTFGILSLLLGRALTHHQMYRKLRSLDENQSD